MEVANTNSLWQAASPYVNGNYGSVVATTTQLSFPELAPPVPPVTTEEAIDGLRSLRRIYEAP